LAADFIEDVATRGFLIICHRSRSDNAGKISPRTVSHMLLAMCLVPLLL
jgi:hypothetical protein